MFYICSVCNLYMTRTCHLSYPFSVGSIQRGSHKKGRGGLCFSRFHYMNMNSGHFVLKRPPLISVTFFRNPILLPRGREFSFESPPGSRFTFQSFVSSGSYMTVPVTCYIYNNLYRSFGFCGIFFVENLEVSF